MKNKLLPLIFVLGGYSAYSQVGIGTPMPNASAQLEVVSTNKGVLIPRVSLTGSTDATTIVNGNVNSLLVFNTGTIADVKPGYYYWYGSKWNRIAMSDESVGMAGGDGAPGAPGVIIPGDATIYVDKTTGTVYVLEPGSNPANWIPISGAAGNNGKDGMTGGNGAPGAPGVTIPADATIYVDNTTGIVYILKPGTDPKEWITLNGNSGKDGLPGGDGAPGEPGVTIPADATIYVDNTTGIVYVAKPGSNPKEWIALNNNNGKDGLPGGDGAPGTPGVTIPADATIYVDKTTGIVYVLEPGSSPANWIAVNGNNGKDGLPGGDGAPGTPGVTIPADATIYVDKTTGTVYVLEPGSSPANWIAVNGKDGLPGGEGAPGTPGVTIPADAVIYIDKTTGIIYVRDPEDATKWITLNGQNGLDGKNGINGGTGLPGDAGLDATVQMYIDYATGIVYVRDPQDPTKWVPVTGKDGIDGKNGINGGTGLPGDAGLDASIQMYIDYATGIVYVRDPEDPTKWVPVTGKDGIDGKNGINGGTGLPGDAGLDASIQMYIDYTTGVVYVRDPQDPTKWVPVTGKDGMSGGNGLPGQAGLDGTVQMYVDKATGTVYVRDPEDATKWIAINGKNGIDGKNGINGGTGLPGDAGLDATVQMYIDYATGIVYVRDPQDPTKWVPVTGKNGVNGGAGLPGQAGLDGTVQIYVDKATGIVYVRDPQDATKWVAINGPAGNNGKDGMIGGTGVPGTPGASGITADSTVYIDSATGMVYILKPGTDPLVPANWIPVNGEDKLTSLTIGATGNLDYKDETGAITSLDIAKASKEPWFNVATNLGATSNEDSIYTKGWVGIGFDKPSDTPNEKLRVNGTITTVNGYYADYVFEDYFKGFSEIKADYKFKSLLETEKYIKTHKHLPGITPINELEKTKEGYSFNMSELSIQLLEKTEELYLHVIEQNNAIIQKDKEIEIMNQRLEKLEKLIEENINSSNLTPLSSK